MKKTSLFVIIVSFLLSIFLISLFGNAVRDDQFKVYFQHVEITTFDGYLGGGDDKLKYKQVEFKKDEGEVSVAIDYLIEPQEASNSNAFEFQIIGGNETFIDEQSGEEKECAILTLNVLTFYHPAAVNIMLHTTDGSTLYDFCLFICSSVDTDI